MLFMIHYRPKAGWSEAIAKRATRLFDNWKPPAGFNIKAHYAQRQRGRPGDSRG